MKIKELVHNLRDDLNTADSLLSWLKGEHPEIYAEIQKSEIGDALLQDIRSDLDYTTDLAERIDLALLMAAEIGDVAIPTVEDIYEKEEKIELPYKNGFIDTEIVYNSIGKWTEEIKKSK